MHLIHWGSDLNLKMEWRDDNLRGLCGGKGIELDLQLWGKKENALDMNEEEDEM